MNRLLILMVALAAVLLAGWWLWGGTWEGWFGADGSVRWLQAAGPWAWLAGIGLLVADLVLPVPGTVVISALGYVYGVWLGGMIAAAGLVAAGCAGYGVGRLCGEEFARRWLGRRDFDSGRKWFEKSGGWMVALSRALPILPEVVSCSAGLVRMPFGRFLTALVCGSLPMGMIFAAVGQAGRETPAWAVGLSVALPALLWLAAWRWRR